MIKRVSWIPTFINLNCINKQKREVHIQARKPLKREIVPFKVPERLSEEGEKRIAKCETLYSKNSHKHLKGGGRRILQGEDSKVKTQKIDQIQF